MTWQQELAGDWWLDSTKMRGSENWRETTDSDSLSIPRYLEIRIVSTRCNNSAATSRLSTIDQKSKLISPTTDE